MAQSSRDKSHAFIDSFVTAPQKHCAHSPTLRSRQKRTPKTLETSIPQYMDHVRRKKTQVPRTTSTDPKSSESQIKRYSNQRAANDHKQKSNTFIKRGGNSSRRGKYNNMRRGSKKHNSLTADSLNRSVNVVPLGGVRVSPPSHSQRHKTGPPRKRKPPKKQSSALDTLAHPPDHRRPNTFNKIRDHEAARGQTLWAMKRPQTNSPPPSSIVSVCYPRLDGAFSDLFGKNYSTADNFFTVRMRPDKIHSYLTPSTDQPDSSIIDSWSAVRSNDPWIDCLDHIK